MNPFTALSTAEQVAEHLRAELLRGGVSGTMPGVHPLAAELGVNHKTVKAALRMLEDEGLLVNQGRGVQRCIALPDDHAPPALRASPDLVPVSTRDCPTGRRVRRALSAASTRCSGPPRPPP
jgi:DNA-binding transcriptional MocR family regulator